MLTGQRRNEIADLRRCEIVDDTIVLPGERTKNGRKHIVPLSKPAQTILSACTRDDDDEFVFWRTCTRDGDDRFVFRRRHGDRVITSYAKPKRLLDAALLKRGHTLAPWVLHDLRRSVATHMGEIGIQPHVIEAVLNHVGGSRAGVAGVYNKSKLEEPKRQALAAWAEYLMALVEDRALTSDKIVPLRA
jgi:integrase